MFWIRFCFIYWSGDIRHWNSVSPRRAKGWDSGGFYFGRRRVPHRPRIQSVARLHHRKSNRTATVSWSVFYCYWYKKIDIQSNLCITTTLRAWKTGLLCGGLSEKYQWKAIARLDVDPSGWPLLTGGRCSEVAVSTDLPVLTCWFWLF